MSKQLLTEVLYRNRFKESLVRPEVLALFHFYNNVTDSSRWGQSMWKSDEATFARPAQPAQMFSSQNSLYVAEPTDPHVLTLSLSPALNLNCFTFELIFSGEMPFSAKLDTLEILFKSTQNNTLLKYEMSGYSLDLNDIYHRYYDVLLTDVNANVTPLTRLFTSKTSGGGTHYHPVKAFMLTGLQGVYSAYGRSRNNTVSWQSTSGTGVVLTSNATPGLVSSIEFKAQNLYLHELRILNNICRLTGNYHSTTNTWRVLDSHYTGTEVYQ